jgi:hypothetical protein
MPDFSNTYGNYLKAADLKGRAWQLTIHAAHVETFNRLGGATGEKQNKLVLGFRETTKQLICNATNARTLADAFTANTDALVGKRIRIESRHTNMGDAIFVSVPAQPPTAPSRPDIFGADASEAPPPAPDDPGAFDNDIPL